MPHQGEGAVHAAQRPFGQSDRLGVQQMRHLPRVAAPQTDDAGGAGETGQQSRLQRTLEVDDQVVAGLLEVPQEGGQGPPRVPDLAWMQARLTRDAGQACRANGDSSDKVAYSRCVAAELNRFMGAGINPNTIMNIDKAVVLNGKYAFNGLTHGTLTAADTTKANCLATQLDNYNNNRAVSTCP